MSIFYETIHFTLESGNQPHISRTDGGHMVIMPKERVLHRWNFDVPRAKALMRLSMLAGEAMMAALNERGIPVERLNFQDNGNWGIDAPGGPHFHMHIYGRARGSINQAHGEALRFPSRDEFFKLPWLEPVSDEDRAAIRAHIERLRGEERYSFEQWGITED